MLRSFTDKGRIRGEESGLRRRGRVRARGASGSALCIMKAQQQRRQPPQQPPQQQFQRAEKPLPLSLEVTSGIVASISACEAGGGCGVGVCFVFSFTAFVAL